MLNLLLKTLPFLLMRIGIFFLSGSLIFGIALLCRNLGLQLTQNVPLLHWVSQPAFLIIGVGIGIALHTYILSFVIHMLSLVHVIATTTVLLNVPYQGSLIGFAFSQTKKNFLQVTSASVLTIKGVAALKKFKDTLIEKDILTLFNEPDTTIQKSIFNLTKYNINCSLETIDEVIVSYTWLATYLYDMGANEPDELDDEGNQILEGKRKKKPSIKTRIKNQAKFMLNGLAFYTRVLPKMLIWGFFQMAVVEVFSIIISVIVWVLVFSIMGINLISITLVLLTGRLILQLVDLVILKTIRVDITLLTYYTELSKLDNVTPEMVSMLVTKIPPLASIAKKTGLAEFKDIQIPDKSEGDVDGCLGGLISQDEMREALRSAINETCKVFQVDEHDILKKPSTADADITAEAEQPEEAYKPVEESNIHEVTERIKRETETIESIDPELSGVDTSIESLDDEDKEKAEALKVFESMIMSRKEI